jgi:hypothetical protein
VSSLLKLALRGALAVAGTPPGMARPQWRRYTHLRDCEAACCTRRPLHRRAYGRWLE